MSKTMISLIAGILFAWLVISFITKNFDGNFLFALLIGVFLGYGVKKKEGKY
ncbi:hypothetical protein [Sporosarcina sp. Marseille-Q4943]|uniref:hypothetical protein n=1 Tax=Sporosarcina sp. Marseille-Q4943 TaxID=2942204 RepID=UPI00208DB5F8|nr:hypothetical protein [Sporosarcina sp. Marseille-Q4943]